MYQIAILAILFLSIKASEGAYIFESVNARLYCYGDEQPGCNSSFPDAFPQYGYSVLNVTRAETFLYLFTPRNPDHPELLHKCGGRLPPNSNFDPTERIMFIMPGFVSGICNFAIFREIKNEWMKRGDTSVFATDWMWGNIFDLQDARRNMQIVADQIATVVRWLKEDYGIPENNITCMGHSYGAHLCGFISQRERIGIIHGVEPSGVVQTERSPSNMRLNPTDANCVQGIHTNGGQCLPWYFGANFTVGKFDIYLNGGLFQPNCAKNTMESFMKGDYIFGTFSLLPAACSHFQALQYYKASINPDTCEFVAIKCESYEKFKAGQCRTCNSDGSNCVIMGAHGCNCLTDEQKSAFNEENDQKYYLDTKAFCPYCDNSDININGKSCMKN